MKISRQQLNVIIENYLLLEEINEASIRSTFKNALEQLKREFLNTSKFTEMIRNSVVNELGKTHLYIVPKDDPINDNPEVSSYEGYALHVKFVRGEEKPKKEYFDTDIIKDKDLEAAFAKKPITNPIVVIFEKNIILSQLYQKLILIQSQYLKNFLTMKGLQI